MTKEIFAGKFEVQREISRGQTGTIYYGYDLELRQEVAIKVYHSHLNGRVIRGKTFIEKAKPLLLLDHPNLIRIFKVEEEADTPIVFMEFFDAPNLHHLIHEKGPLSTLEMLKLARGISEVLVHTHLQGIIHGTLHPGHVLVGPQGQIKVMDLGLSWILMDILSNCDEELLRPLAYLPPELAKGELLNVSSDLYCLGFMMYDMLTQRVPYSGLPKTSIMGQLAFDQKDPAFSFPESVPEPIRELIIHMTRNKSQHRLQDATHVLTIINQQLAKLGHQEPATTPQNKPVVAPHLPAQDGNQSEEPVSPPPLSEVDSDPSLQRTPPVQRPETSINYNRVRHVKIFRKLGFVLGIVLLIAGGAMGYWYREFLEPIPPTMTTPTVEPTHESLPTQPPFSASEIQPSMENGLTREEPQVEDSSAMPAMIEADAPQPVDQGESSLPKTNLPKEVQNSEIPSSEPEIPLLLGEEKTVPIEQPSDSQKTSFTHEQPELVPIKNLIPEDTLTDKTPSSPLTPQTPELESKESLSSPQEEAAIPNPDTSIDPDALVTKENSEEAK